jgi:hypothetical protein
MRSSDGYIWETDNNRRASVQGSANLLQHSFRR